MSGLDLDDLCDGGGDGDISSDVGSPGSGDNTPTNSAVKGVAHGTHFHRLHDSDVCSPRTEVSTSDSDVKLPARADADTETFQDQAA